MSEDNGERYAMVKDGETIFRTDNFGAARVMFLFTVRNNLQFTKDIRLVDRKVGCNVGRANLNREEIIQ